MTVPRRFVGAWSRERLEVDGRVVVGAGPAVWVEVGGTYVDVRGPGTGTSGLSFGGRSSWRAPMFTWHHDVEVGGTSNRPDRGALSAVDADHIVERGVGLTGDGIPYVEHWHRLPSDDVTTALASHARGRAVRVGDYAAAVSRAPAAARLWRRDASAWSEWIALGPAAELPAPRAAGWRLPRGWSITT